MEATIATGLAAVVDQVTAYVENFFAASLSVNPTPKSLPTPYGLVTGAQVAHTSIRLLHVWTKEPTITRIELRPMIEDLLRRQPFWIATKNPGPAATMVAFTITTPNQETGHETE